MDAMKDALVKRKKNVMDNMKISIEFEPIDPKEEEKEKKMGLAPSVKDVESPKEKKLMANAPEMELPGQVNSTEEEMSESPADMDKESMMGMPEMPNGRGPNSLHEKAMMAMMQSNKMKKNLKK